jgi:hypothetical protein
MLDPTEMSQVHDLVWQETADMVAIMSQPPGSYRFLCNVGGIVMFTHHRVGTVLREY